MRKDLKFAILKNEKEHPAKWWVDACNEMGYKYDVIDLIKEDWLERCLSEVYNCFLTCPSGSFYDLKKMYDERVYILFKEFGFFLYPSFEEISLHENKKMTYYWLSAKNLPRINTNIFYDKNEAIKNASVSKYPLVVKTSLGTTAAGVFIVSSKNELIKKINLAFAKGIRRKVGPNFRQRNIGQRFRKVFADRKLLIEKIMDYKSDFMDLQKGYIIIQDYVEHEFEWRVVKIGESFFAYKKLKIGDFCSGSKNFNYDNIPESILDFAKEICEIGKFNSMSLDCFETEDGNYLINELQTVFGHENPYLSLVDNESGRYIFSNGRWCFEKGDFNRNMSFNLRLENVVQIVG